MIMDNLLHDIVVCAVIGSGIGCILVFIFVICISIRNKIDIIKKNNMFTPLSSVLIEYQNPNGTIESRLHVYRGKGKYRTCVITYNLGKS